VGLKLVMMDGGWQTRLGKQDSRMGEILLGGVAALLGRDQTTVGRCEDLISPFAEVGKWEESFPTTETAANSHDCRHFPSCTLCSVHPCSLHGVFAAVCN
jgi:hypothetical protein